jgi:peptidyl-tRNA hydrolase
MSAVLFIIMRTDLKSMNNGKGIAQGSHASNKAAKAAESLQPELYKDWASQTDQDFGTVLTLHGGKMADIEELIAEIQGSNYVHKQAMVADVVHDPTYPLRDGDFTHYIPINTCAYVMCYEGSAAHKALAGLKLHA